MNTLVTIVIGFSLGLLVATVSVVFAAFKRYRGDDTSTATSVTTARNPTVGVAGSGERSSRGPGDAHGVTDGHDDTSPAVVEPAEALSGAPDPAPTGARGQEEWVQYLLGLLQAQDLVDDQAAVESSRLHDAHKRDLQSRRRLTADMYAAVEALATPTRADSHLIQEPTEDIMMKGRR